MDTSSEYQESIPTPETAAQRVQAIKGLIEGQDDVQPGEAQSPDDGAEVQAVDDGREGSQPREMDSEEPESASSVDDDTEGEPQDADEEPGDAPVTLKSLAAHLEVDPADLYELEIGVGDGESVTLGALKDQFKEYGPVKEYEARIREQQDNFERQTLQTRAELNHLMQLIPEQVREQMIRQAQERHKAYEGDQERMVLESIPDWKEPEKRAADRELIVRHGESYGFTEAEIAYTHDHRTLRLLRDAARDRAELASLRSATKKRPGQASKPGKRASGKNTRLRNLLTKGKQAKTMQGKTGVVSELLRNG